MGLLSAFRYYIVGLLITLTPFALHGQVPRIKGSLQHASTADLKGSISPRASLAHDDGLAPEDQPLSNLSLRFSRSAKQQTQLDQLLLDQQTPSSPDYHRWLSPEQFRQRFGVADLDLTKITDWLADHGFHSVESGQGGSFVRFAGTVRQVEDAFGAEMHTVSLRNERHIANLKHLRLPAELAAITVAVTGLDDFSPKPHHKMSFGPLAASTDGKLRAQYTSSSGAHYLAPDDFHTIYDENPLLNAGMSGQGVTVAVVGQTDISLSDITAFRSAGGLSAIAPIVALYGSDPGVTSNADLLEAELDVEWAGATAPGATILYVNSTSVVDGSLTEAIDKNLAPIIALSYGDCEADLGVSSLAYYSLLLQQASAEGISVVAPAGGAGATDCDSNVASATHGFAVDFPASSPLVTGVGGTSFDDFAGNYFSTANGPQGGSALSYIPEVVWNDDALGGIAAGGGGRSAYFAKPAWQAGNGVPNDFSRDVPDIALNASPNHDPYLICTSGHCQSGFADAAGAVEFVGGTSVGPPAFAGVLALVVQKTGGRLGNVNPVLYALANSRYGSAAFHDIVSGTNASPCTAGSPDCPSGGQIGFAAVAGYDLATGLGSINAFGLLSNWTSVAPVLSATGPLPSVTNLAGDTNNVRAGTPVLFTVSVKSAAASSSATPTGTVQLSLNGVPIGSTSTLTSGVTSLTIDTTAFAAGIQTIQATYSGDSIFMGSKGAFVLTVNPANVPDFSLTPATATVAVTSGQVAQGVVLTASALNGFSGKVQLTASAPSTLNAEYSFSANPIDLTSSTSSSSTLILFAYKGAPQVRHSGAQAQGEQTTILQKALAPGIAAAGIFSCFWIRRRKLPALLAALIAICSFGFTGCGKSSESVPNGNVPAKTGTYSVLVTATASLNGTSLVHSSTITFVVQ